MTFTRFEIETVTAAARRFDVRWTVNDAAFLLRHAPADLIVDQVEAFGNAGQDIRLPQIASLARNASRRLRRVD